MSLTERIAGDIRESMKSKEADRLSTLRMAKAALMNEQNKQGVGYVLSNEEELKVLQSLVKQRKDSFEQYSSAGRADLAAKEQGEIAVLEAYLPKAASAEEISSAVDHAIAECGASSMKDMGPVMKAVLARLQGLTVDGRLVSEAVKTKLQ